MIKSNVLHIVDLTKGYVEGYVRHDKSGREIPVSAYENSKVGASASSLSDNSELCHGLSMGKLMARVEMSKSCRNDLRNVLAHLTSEYGDRGVSVFEDWVNPAKIGARLFSKVMASGEQPKAVRANLTPAIERYERDFQEVLREEGFKRSLTGCIERLFHILDLDLLKAHVKAHFRKDPKTGKLIFVHDYHNSVQAYPDHEHITFEKGEKVETKNGPGTIMGYDEKKHVLRIKLDDGKYASVTPHLVKHLEKKEPAKEKTFDEKVKDANVDVEGILGAKEPEEKKQTIDSMDIFNLASILGAGTSGDIVDKWVGWIKSVEGKPIATEEYLSYIKPSMMNASDHIVAKAIALQHTGHQEALQKVYGVLKKKAEEKLGHPLEEEKPAEPEPKKDEPVKPPEPDKPAEPEPKEKKPEQTAEEIAAEADKEYKQQIANFKPDKDICKPMPKTAENPDGIPILNTGMLDTSQNPKAVHYGLKAKDGTTVPLSTLDTIKQYLKLTKGSGPGQIMSGQAPGMEEFKKLVTEKSLDEIRQIIEGSNDPLYLYHIYKAAQNNAIGIKNYPVAWEALVKLNQIAAIKDKEFLAEQYKKDKEYMDLMKEVKDGDFFNKLNVTGKTRDHLSPNQGETECVKIMMQDLEDAGYVADDAARGFCKKAYKAIYDLTSSTSDCAKMRAAYYLKYLPGKNPYSAHANMSQEDIEKYSTMIEHMEEYLSIAPPYAGPGITIFRGKGHKSDISLQESMNPGDIMCMGVPGSGSSSQSTSESFDGKCMMFFEGGHPKAVSVKFISYHSSENEVQTAGGTKFKVTKKYKDKDGRLCLHLAVVGYEALHGCKHLSKLKKKGK